ncbi:MAG: hypothetical protein WCB27_21925 [Thermoguttaceae bacterium]
MNVPSVAFGTGDLLTVTTKTHFRQWHALQDAAGILKKNRFGFHAIRKTVATMLYEVSLGAAQFALGHTTNNVTRKHYVDGGGMVARALDQLPQPEGLLATG